MIYDLSIATYDSPDVLRKANGEVILGENALRRFEPHDSFTKGAGRKFVVEYFSVVDRTTRKNTLTSRVRPPKFENLDQFMRELKDWPYDEETTIVSSF